MSVPADKGENKGRGECCKDGAATVKCVPGNKAAHSGAAREAPIAALHCFIYCSIKLQRDFSTTSLLLPPPPSPPPPTTITTTTTTNQHRHSQPALRDGTDCMVFQEHLDNF
ncbi:hypothetical protein E2C01_056134 [Portunus trituberculatus]|uniref:Uncharacterized protein n=1 Tax=Portunus trituberculatus TaxID=210409 RepID=A0A5B7GZJ4_PORTR|nr:hypothetical protein [Portunus trituberculatus]